MGLFYHPKSSFLSLWGQILSHFSAPCSHLSSLSCYTFVCSRISSLGQSCVTMRFPQTARNWLGDTVFSEHRCIRDLSLAERCSAQGSPSLFPCDFMPLRGWKNCHVSVVHGVFHWSYSVVDTSQLLDIFLLKFWSNFRLMTNIPFHQLLPKKALYAVTLQKSMLA